MSVRVLPGLPTYGPLAIPFSATGQGTHREGLVIEFEGVGGGGTWTGNFQRGATGYDDVLQTPDSPEVTVIAGGQAYVVNQDTRKCVRMFGGDIHEVLHVEGVLIFSNGLWLEAVEQARWRWKTRRLSWDGFRKVRIEGDCIVGEAFTPMGEQWEPFSASLSTGEAEGGTYPRDLP